MPALPVDIYVRVSRRGGRGHLTSEEDQERDARQFAAGHGLTTGKVIRDMDQSGGKLERPGLSEARARIASGESGGIVVAYLSRATRDTAQGLMLLDEITRAGGAVYAPNLPDYTNADGRMLTTIQLAIDTGYRQRKSAEFDRAKAGAIAAGIPVITRPAVGYRQRKDRRLEPDPRSAPTIREAFERRAAGEGPTAIGRFLEANRVRTSQGSKTWSKQAVAGLIKSRTYLGELRSGKHRNPAAHEPIVDLALWTAAQHPNPRKAPARKSDGYLLSGLIRCSGCGYSLQGTPMRKRRVYRCTVRHAGGICPAPVYVECGPADATATEAFWALVADIHARGTTDAGPALDALQAAYERAQRALKQYMAPDVQEAVGDAALWAEGLRERSQARDRAAEALGLARAARPADDVPDVATLRDVWENGTTAERRELLAARFDCFALYRDPVEVVAYPTGTAPDGLPRQGFKARPGMVPFPQRPVEQGAGELAAA
jgi:DNA invertase Pin-like site-specific DNA recombinase